MSSNSEKPHSHVNKRRLSLLLGLLAMAAVVAAYPAMCTVHRIGSWLKGGVGAGTRAAVPSVVDKGLEQSKHAPEIKQKQREQGKVTLESNYSNQP
ncbi:MAG: hypothetical protein ACYC7D_11335 [Nitrososphaerales archaeon]